MDNNKQESTDIYINGERTFEVNINEKDDRGYVLVKDTSYKNGKGYFYLPLFIINNFKPGKQ